MSSAYNLLFDRALSRMDPEAAHAMAFSAIRAGGPLVRSVQRLVPEAMSSHLRTEHMGVMFAHPLGLAAGFDKNGIGIDALASLGFSHVEIGTVTALPQPGNPQPRLFRLPADRALLNRMGFNNDGAEVVAARLRAREATLGPTAGQVVVGVNIGKSKVVDEADENAVLADYATSTRLLAPYARYLVVNVSSPNTPGLRNLQAVEKLEPLLRHVRRIADEAVPQRRVPLLVKIAPDLSDDDVIAVANLAETLDLDGIIATNTTIRRDGLATPEAEVASYGAGGVSGEPLAQRSVEVLKLLKSVVPPSITLISVGGISTGTDAIARLDAGADLLQAYTGFVYGGPRWAARLVRHLKTHLTPPEEHP